MVPLVHTTGLSKRYSVGGSTIHAVRGISLQIERREFVAIRGRSGSGKSSLMHLLGLLEHPDTGNYELDGRSTTNLSEEQLARMRSREIGFVFQIPALLPRASALENVELPLSYAGVPRGERRRRAKRSLERVGLGHRAHHWPNQLSGGEQQRVVIARAIVNDPALVLADEPTGALDSETGEQILQLFEQLHRDGCTVVVITHAADVAVRAQRRITLHDGQVADNSVETWCRDVGIRIESSSVQ